MIQTVSCSGSGGACSLQERGRGSTLPTWGAAWQNLQEAQLSLPTMQSQSSALACLFPQEASSGDSVKNASCAWHQCPVPPNQAGRGRKSALHRTLRSPGSGLSKVGAKIPSPTQALNSALGARNPRPVPPPMLPTPQEEAGQAAPQVGEEFQLCPQCRGSLSSSLKPNRLVADWPLHSVFQENRGSLKVTAGCSPQTPPLDPNTAAAQPLQQLETKRNFTGGPYTGKMWSELPRQTESRWLPLPDAAWALLPVFCCSLFAIPVWGGGPTLPEGERFGLG